MPGFNSHLAHLSGSPTGVYGSKVNAPTKHVVKQADVSEREKYTTCTQKYSKSTGRKNKTYKKCTSHMCVIQNTYR